MIDIIGRYSLSLAPECTMILLSNWTLARSSSLADDAYKILQTFSEVVCRDGWYISGTRAV